MSKSKTPNGISWMVRSTTWQLAEAATKMKAQCPVTARNDCINGDDDPEDAFAQAYDERKHAAVARARLELEAPIKEQIVIKPVPSYAELATQHEG